jgi:lipopolysaccharide/colanic/teichoic acid biosynthesis glycosyltransferase
LSFLSLGQLVTAHIALVVSYPVLRISKNSDEDDCEDTASPASPWIESRARRLFECSVAAMALVGLLPVLAVCSILVRLSSPGPVFFKQRRMGRNGREFELYKFRSMRIRCAASASSHTVCNDERITQIGRLLRRYKLDEIPQFWNVLKGDMSLVGPRPKLSHHEALRMSYRPGLTGEATLVFRHEERMLLELPAGDVDRFYDFFVKPVKAALDIEYMRSATFLSDVQLLLRTFRSCLNCNADPNHELHHLLARYACEHRKNRHSDQSAAACVNIRTTPRFLPEMKDDFGGNLDDAA